MRITTSQIALSFLLALTLTVLSSCTEGETENPLPSFDPTQVAIEMLKFQVNPDSLENWIDKDREIWTAQLSSYPGFIKKEVWQNPEVAGELTLIVYWATREAWKSIPEQELIETDARFIAAVGADTFQFVSAGEFKPWVFADTGTF